MVGPFIGGAGATLEGPASCPSGRWFASVPVGKTIFPKKGADSLLRKVLKVNTRSKVLQMNYRVTLNFIREERWDPSYESVPPTDLLAFFFVKGERARSVLPIPVVVVSVKYTVPIVTIAVFPSVFRAKVRFSVPASKINSSGLKASIFF